MDNNSLTVFGNNAPEVKSTKIVKFNGTGFDDATPVVLFDASGSMNDDDCPNGEERIEVVNRISKKMQNLPVYYFNNAVHKAECGFMSAEGSTNLYDALDVCIGRKKVILVSDGCPDEQTKAMVKAISMRIPFDTILIGKDEEGRKFMQELSKRTGGNFSEVSTSDFQFQEKLESGINRLLLGDGK